MRLEPGRMLGSYRIEAELGRGGMATVYKAYHAALARFVAVKVLPEYFAEEPGFKERFQQEAIAVANLRHRNIPAVHDYGETEGVNYIVSEYIDGGTLTESLGAALPPQRAVDVLGPIAEALDYAHEKGVLHRDVKPSNVLLERDGTPVLADFGLARIMASDKSRLTQTGTIVGTPEYMSPEQCEGDELTPAADQYALAVVAYEMLTGRPPFTGPTPLSVILAQVKDPLPMPRSLNPALPHAVEEVLLKALDKRPADRYTSCVEFVAALKAASQQMVVVEAPARPEAGDLAPAPKPKKTKPKRPPRQWKPPPLPRVHLPPAGQFVRPLALALGLLVLLSAGTVGYLRLSQLTAGRPTANVSGSPSPTTEPSATPSTSVSPSAVASDKSLAPKPSITATVLGSFFGGHQWAVAGTHFTAGKVVTVWFYDPYNSSSFRATWGNAAVQSNGTFRQPGIGLSGSYPHGTGMFKACDTANVCATVLFTAP